MSITLDGIVAWVEGRGIARALERVMEHSKIDISLTKLLGDLVHVMRPWASEHSCVTTETLENIESAMKGATVASAVAMTA